ncbi:MAG TPA: carbohydrate binding domain-containing protein, partial [Abditibacteriaceae bacterium]|nr:carbohydrate binding domain-containing protein [Abditibacteriaceae bacterium]
MLKLAMLWAAVLWTLGGIARAQTSAWNFEAGPITWQPQAKTITVSRAEGVTATKSSKASLLVQGRMAGDWHYIVSEPVPLQPRRLYRLSAWVRVDKAGPTTPLPGLQCMLLGAEPASYLGFPGTNRYDPAKMGRWQRLTTEFQTPEGTARCQLSLGTSTTAAVEINAYLDDVVLEPIQRLSALKTYRLNPLPPTLRKVRYQHPRLYFNAQRVAQLREAIKTTHRTIWEEVQAKADEA